MPPRRSLGALSPSTINSRASLGAGPARVEGPALAKERRGKRMTMAGGVQTQAMAAAAEEERAQADKNADKRSRQSVGARTDSNRRMSVLGRPSSASLTRQDPRPLADKAFVAQNIRTLIAFLTTHGYDHAVSPKTLATPTSKEFLHIVQFIFRFVDKNIKFSPKVEEDVPILFKRLCYPFQISKSALCAVGSPHTWPALLAALVWVVELLNYEAKAEEIAAAAPAGSAANDIHDTQANRLFFDYVAKSYTHFLHGRDEECAKLDEELRGTFANREENLAQEVESLEASAAELEAELEALRAGPSPLAAAEAEREAATAELAGLERAIAELEEEQAGLHASRAEAEAGLASTEASSASVCAECERLSEQIAAQPLSSADVTQMRQERSRLQRELATATAHRESQQKLVWESEASLEKRVEEVEGFARAYNAAAERIKLVPASAKRAEGVDYALRLDWGVGGGAAADGALPVDGSGPTHAQQLALVSGLDLKGAVKPYLCSIRDQYAGKMREKADALLLLQEKQDTSDEGLQERIEENAQLASRLAALEKEHKAEKERLERDVASLNAETASVTAEAARLRDESRAQLSEAEQKSESLQRTYEEMARGVREEKMALNNALLAAMELLMNHKQGMQESVERLARAAADAAAEMQIPI